MLGILVHDEELAAGGVGRGGTSHAQHAPLVLEVILHTVEEELALDAVAGTAHAGSFGAAALNHEAGDNPVENQAVVIVVIAQVDEIGNALGCFFGVQLALNHTAVFHGNLKSRVHIIAPSWRGRFAAWHPARPLPVVYRKASCLCTDPPSP